MITEEPHTNIFDFLEHPLIHGSFTVALVGWIFWMVLLWGWNRDKFKKQGKSFWDEIKDEGVVAFIGVCVGVVYDSQALYAYDVMIEWVTGKEIDSPTELGPQHYMLIAPVTERLYAMGGAIYKKFQKTVEDDE